MRQPSDTRAERPGEPSPGGSLRFRILGPIEVDTGGPPVHLGGPKQRAVLAHLAVRANQLVTLETLVDRLWGDEPPDTARNVIQTYVSHLRKALGPGRIESHGRGYRLRLEPSELDAARFDELLREAKRVLPVDPSVAVATLDDALVLWRGPALADLTDGASLLAEAARLDELRLDAQETRIEGLLAAEDPARVVRETEALLVDHPWRERLWGLLMLAYYREGRQGDALGAYQRAREMLAEEVGVDPSPELVRLHGRILAQDPDLDLRGEQLRGYRLLEKIDDGPVGVVFRGIQPHVERDVAVKVFHERVAADADFVRGFEPNVQAVAALEHPGIVPIYDYWREPGRAYVVSRYMRGGNLHDVEQRGERLDRAASLRAVEQVAVALAFAHAQGVTHGNVAPTNVLFDAEGNAFLADFRAGRTPGREPADDVRALVNLALRLFPGEPALHDLQQRATTGLLPDATGVAEAVRAALDPTGSAAPPPSVVRNPYKGLRAFAEADARDFFGRASLTDRLLLSVSGDRARFLAVVGPSGAGKSSVVRAGLVPAMRARARSTGVDAFVAEMLPGAHPMEQLEAALLSIAVEPVPHLRERLRAGPRGLLEASRRAVPPSAEVVLLVDQFEEAFTLTDDERERQLFLESLRVAAHDPESRCRVVITLRADFYDRPLVHPRFGQLLAERTEAVPALTPDELEQAIRGPVQRIGVQADPGLVAEMIADVAHQPGALPLLQYALTELFEHREGDRLTLASYEAIGRIGGALSARAERIHASLGPQGQRAARQVFLRLVALGEGRQDTRRRVHRSELDALDVPRRVMDTTLDVFGRHRLLTFDRDASTREQTIEIAHEALIGGWARLRAWLDEGREDLRLNRGLVLGAAEWRASGHEASFLLRGARLDQLESWAEDTDLAIGRPERAYLKASVDLRDHEREAEELRRQHEVAIERRSARRLRSLVGVLAVASLVGATLTAVATTQRARAEDAARDALARELAATAVATLELDPELSILLAIEAVEATRSSDGTVLREAEEALHRAVVASRLVVEVPGVGGRVAWSPAGVLASVVGRSLGAVDLRDVETGRRLRTIDAHEGAVTGVVFSPDGARMATTGEDRMLKVWDPATGELVTSARGRGDAQGPSFSADGRRVAAAWTEDFEAVRVLDLTTGQASIVSVPEAAGTALSPDGTQVAVAKRWPIDETGVVADVENGRVAFTLHGENCCAHPTMRGIAWSPDGRLVAVSSQDNTRVWDAPTGELEHVLVGHTGLVTDVAWSRDSSRLVTGSSDGTAKVWDLGVDGVRERWSLSAQEMRSGVHGVAFSPDGTKVLGGDALQSATKVWDLGPSGDAEWVNLPAPGFPAAEFMPDGRRVVTSSWQSRPDRSVGGALTFWDLETGRQTGDLGPPRGRFWFAAMDVSPDGSTIALGGGNSTVSFGGASAARAWDTSTGEEQWRVAHGLDVNEVAHSRDGEYVATADWSGVAKIVGRSGEVVARVGDADRDDNFSDVGFSADGRLLATAAFNGSLDRVRVWEWETGRIRRTLQAEGPWAQLDFHPTLPRLVLTGSDEHGEVWDVETGDRMAVLAGRPGGIRDIVYSADGARIATASVDGAVRLFDGDTGEQQLTLRGSGCAVEGVAFSPDGSRLASTSWCDGVRVWALDVDDLLDIAHREAARSLTADECRQYLHVARCPTD